jgi:hypothetical protein
MIDGVELTAADLAVLSDRPVPETTATPEPAPEAAPAPAPAAEPEKPATTDKTPQPRDDKGKFDTKDGDPEKKLVPLDALHEERARRKELQEKLDAVERQRAADMAKLEERLRVLAGNQQPAQQPEAPSVEADPVGAIKRLDGTVQDVAQRLQVEARQRDLTALYQASAREFSAKTPDFQDAYAHLMNVRAGELAAAGVPPHEIPMWIQRGELNMAAQALQQGVSPAERLYSISKALGYAPKPAEQPTPSATPIPAPAAPVGPAPQKALETIAAGQAAAASLAAAGGSAPPTLTLDSLLAMDEDEFAAVATDPKKWRKAMGG